MGRHALIIIRLVNSSFFIFSLTQATTVVSFVDKKHSRRKVVWCDWEGKPSNWTGPLPSVDMVCQGLAFASPSMLHFKNPENFLKGNMTKRLPHWELVLKYYLKSPEIFRYVIKLQDFFISFIGPFKDLLYNSDLPPRMKFPNSSSCNAFNHFVSQTILEMRGEWFIPRLGRGWKREHPSSGCANHRRTH